VSGRPVLEACVQAENWGQILVWISCEYVVSLITLDQHSDLCTLCLAAIVEI